MSTNPSENENTETELEIETIEDLDLDERDDVKGGVVDTIKQCGGAC